MLITVNRAPVLTLWGAVVAERLGHPPHTALTLGRAVAGAAARVKVRNIGREERRPENAKLVEVHVTAPVLLLGKTIRLLPTEDGELRAADGDLPADADAVARYLTKTFGEIPTYFRPTFSDSRATPRPTAASITPRKAHGRWSIMKLCFG